MDSSSVCSSLIAWLETFPGVSNVTVAGLADGVVIGRVLNLVDSTHFNSAWVSRLKPDCGDNWRLKISNLRKIQQSVVEYLQNLNVSYADSTLPDVNRLGETADPQEVARLLQLVLGCAINCHQKERHIETIMSMAAEVQAVVMTTVQSVFMRDTSPGADVAGPASFHPSARSVLPQLEATTRARDQAVARVMELEMQLADAAEKRQELADENARLLERLGGLESEGAEGGTMSRYKELKKKIDSLQDDLFKMETSRDEYRSRVDELDRERGEVMARTEELQRLADQAHALQDEVDALRDMGQRATQAEAAIEAYKKKLDELSDLRRQNKILEEKNADYMQHILELEEDVKKNDTWRPQLELFKKQVSELRQQLHEETKKADRHAFDSKKLNEKLEALTVEKDRVVQERDELKEHVEELRCLNSAQSPSHRSSGPSADLLSSDPQELWERLVRLRHENEQLKKREAEGGSASGAGASSSAPVLQAMLAELQERHDSVSSENRWGAHLKRVTASPSSPHSMISTPTPTRVVSPPPSHIGSSSSSPMAFIDAFINLEDFKKIKLLRRNIKWASDSDLLILRTPSLFSSFLTSFPSSSARPYVHSKPTGVSKSPPNGLREITDLHPPRPCSDGTQHIVIRHIHEFKLPSCAGVGSTEDSGCCRTSPSSCEDGPATMDSGVSGLFDCMSPIVPAIAEDCSSHRLSDIILPYASGRSASNVSGSSYTHLHHHLCHCPHCCRSPSVASHHCGGDNGNQTQSTSFEIRTRSLPNDCVNHSSTRHPSIRPLLPSDSPTPHNSPRIPIRVTRNRSSRSSLSPSPSSYSSLSDEEQMLPKFRRSQSESFQGRARSSDRTSGASFSSNDSLRKHQIRSYANGDHFSNEDEQKKTEFNARDFKMDPIKTSTLIKNKSSISAEDIAFDETSEMKVCLSFNGLEVSSGLNGICKKDGKPVSVVRGVASAIRHPTANSRAQPASMSLTNSPVEGFVREVQPMKSNPSTPKYSLTTNKPLGEVYPSSLSIESNFIVVDSCSVKSKAGNSPLPSRGSFNLETHFGMHNLSQDAEPVTVVRPISKSPNRNGNHVSFKEPAVVVDSLLTRPRTPHPPGKEEQQHSGFRRSASLRITKSTPLLKKPSDITQCSSGTLFTHLELSSPKLIDSLSPPHQNQQIALAFIESDSDEDTLEQRLVSGAFGAPLVSSESYTSVSYDDANDTDLAEYNTDHNNDVYDRFVTQEEMKQIELYKASNRHQNSPLSLSKYSPLSLSKFVSPHLRNSLSKIQEEDIIVDKAPKTQTAVFSSITTHRIREQDRSFKASLRFKKKRKNRTVKSIATETFTAMFLFCTP